MAWSSEETEQITKALAVVAELTGTEFSAPARAYLLRELTGYPARRVLDGLHRAGRECTGKLTLGGIVKALDFVDRKTLSDAAAAKRHEETQLRLLAMTENIPWESGIERVREQLVAKGYRLGNSAPRKEVRSLPHWQDKDE